MVSPADVIGSVDGAAGRLGSVALASDKRMTAKNVSLWYGEKQALFDVDMDIPDRQVTALIGPSGCGKSTFLRCLNRMNDTIDICQIEGDIRLDGENIYNRSIDPVQLRAKVGMVFQKPNPFPKSIYDNIAYGPIIHGLAAERDLIDEIVESSLKGADVLKDKGFSNVVTWGRGVDHGLFRPRSPKHIEGLVGLARPIVLYADRVAVEKGLPDFLDLDLPDSKVVVGDGPMLEELEARYPDITFTGYLSGDTLARTIAAADVFVFPSRTDTFGLVMIEALASGVPVAAFDVPEPRDIITTDDVGAIGDDLGHAIRRALTCRPEHCREQALPFSWDRAAKQFEDHLTPLSFPHKDRLRHVALTTGQRAVLPSLQRWAGTSRHRLLLFVILVIIKS